MGRTAVYRFHKKGFAMKEICTAIEIAAPAALVWQILTDFDKLKEWNPFLRKVTGELKQGARIAVEIGAPGASPMTFQPTLLAVEPNRELRWIGRLFFPGLFDGEHRFLLEPLGDNQTRFVHSEQFSGLLIPMMAKMLDTDTSRGFEAMNAALKARAESSVYSVKEDAALLAK